MPKISLFRTKRAPTRARAGSQKFVKLPRLMRSNDSRTFSPAATHAGIRWDIVLERAGRSFSRPGSSPGVSSASPTLGVHTSLATAFSDARLAQARFEWSNLWTNLMTSQVVNLQVTASIPIDCDFWSEDDGWKGLCKSPAITAHGSSFEDAKKNMAAELQTQIERILREHPDRSARRIA